MKKRYLSFILAVALILSLSTATGFAESEDVSPFIAAEQLNQLGLLKGVDKGNYDMARAPTRTECIVMLLRLLGKENEALRYDENKNPFDDVPGWAAKYVAYAYDNELTKGISDKQFGAVMAADAEQYTTFLLRALNYSDETDFSYGASKIFASSLGLFNGWEEGGKFTRADLIVLSFNALNADFNGIDGTLADYLIDSGVFLQAKWETVLKLNALMAVQRNDYEWKETVHVTATSTDELLREFKNAMLTLPEEVLINVPIGQEKQYFDHFETAHLSLLEYMRACYVRYAHGIGYLRMKPTYSSAFQSLAYLQNPTVPTDGEVKRNALKGLDIYLDRFADIHSDYEYVKAVHDYIADELEYDVEFLPGSEDLGGAMNSGVATCLGYSAMFQFFMQIGGFETELIVGTAKDNRGVTEKHAWNKVKLEGRWYNVDVTWNDPITTDGVGIIRYDYFLISDDALSKDHTWDKSYYSPSPDSW